jgi:hypothetical protein
LLGVGRRRVGWLWGLLFVRHVRLSSVRIFIRHLAAIFFVLYVGQDAIFVARRGRLLRINLPIIARLWGLRFVDHL